MELDVGVSGVSEAFEPMELTCGLAYDKGDAARWAPIHHTAWYDRARERGWLERNDAIEVLREKLSVDRWYINGDDTSSSSLCKSSISPTLLAPRRGTYRITARPGSQPHPSAQLLPIPMPHTPLQGVARP